MGRFVAGMTFRTKLLLFSSCTLAGAVALVTGAVSIAARRAFDRADEIRRVALLSQFDREMKIRTTEIAAQVERVAQSDEVARIAVQSTGEPDFAAFYKTAQTLADRYGLDFLDIARGDRTILSSAHWPARFGYKNDWMPAGDSRPCACAYARWRCFSHACLPCARKELCGSWGRGASIPLS